jgi:hypothetical protein
MPYWAQHSTQHHPLLDAGHRERASEVRTTGIAILVALAVGIGVATVGHSARAWIWGDEASATNDERSPVEAPFSPLR